MKFKLNEDFTLYYDFDASDYPYEVDSSVAADILFRHYSADDLIDMLKDMNKLPDDFFTDDKGNYDEDYLHELVFDNIDALHDKDTSVLKDYFEKDAYELYEDDLAYSKNPYEYYGVSQKDFL